MADPDNNSDDPVDSSVDGPDDELTPLSEQAPDTVENPDDELTPLSDEAPDTVENPDNQPPPPPPPPPSDRPGAEEPNGHPFDADTVDAPAPHPPPETVEVAAPAERTPLELSFHAVSDVGRVRKDNQDSGYAGPWLLTVCDGVGGAARGDIASSTAVNELRQLDEAPGSVDLIDRVNDALHEAHISIGSQVDEDPALSGTSTTATVALFDGNRLAIGHIGDSRGYLLRDGELSQLTNDHTFVQSLIDEGRITEEEARVHPHRNLILKALDGLHEVEPDLFTLELVAGDRLFLCSDGACGVLDDARMAEILADGSPEFSAIELVRASLDAGSSDNVTCVVADVLAPAQKETQADPDAAPRERPDPQVVGAAAELKQQRRLPRALFRGHRSGDTGELEPITAEIPEGIEYAIPADPIIDPEQVRYAPQAPPRYTWARRLLVLAVLIGLAWIAVGTAYWWSQRQYYVSDQDGKVVVFRGVDVPGLSSVYEESNLDLDDLSEAKQESVRDGIVADSPADARERIRDLADPNAESDDPDDDTTSPTSDAPTSPPTAPGATDGAADLPGVQGEPDASDSFEGP